MVNMGFTRLVLIEPLCAVNSKSQQAAAAGQQPLQERVEYASWADFFDHEGDGLRVGMTRRGGKQRVVSELPELLPPHLTPWTAGQTFDRPVYLFFGPEDNGLSSAEMRHMNLFATLPTYGEMGSLNLAQAVLLSLFVVRQVLQTPAHPQGPVSDAPATRRRLHFPETTVREWLETLGFDLSERSTSAYTTLTRILMQNQASDQELRVLEAILQQNLRKLRELQ
jgi:tRNA/rRNA methyltransferase